MPCNPSHLCRPLQKPGHLLHSRKLSLLSLGLKGQGVGLEIGGRSQCLRTWGEDQGGGPSEPRKEVTSKMPGRGLSVRPVLQGRGVCGLLSLGRDPCSEKLGQP